MLTKLTKHFTYTNLTLLTALTLSTIAAWFAIVGLIAIFPARAHAIMVMGAAIEFGKVVATVWLRRYWQWSGWQFKLMLIPMVCVLMLLTSMGTFGFLSAAHSEQALASGDSGAQLAIIDERIKVQRENIDVARRALQQMDAQVDARLSRGDSESGAERAVQIRRQQSGERAKLQKEIGEAQNVIAKLNEERAPLAANQRKIEAEVGPIKYIAALIYGDNPDSNVLERAVRWVIILLVMVFDPLAIALVLAGNSSRPWDKILRKEQEAQEKLESKEEEVVEEVVEQTKTEDIVEQVVETSLKADGVNDFDISKHSYLHKPWVRFKSDVPLQVYMPTKVSEEEKLAPCYKCGTTLFVAAGIGPFCPNKDCDVSDVPFLADEEIQQVTADTPISEIVASVDSDAPIITDGVTIEVLDEPPFVEGVVPGYVTFEGKQYSKEALRGLYPELFAIQPDTDLISAGFGTEFPRSARKGDTWVRVDTLPNRVFKFDGTRWIETAKNTSDSYIQNTSYVQYLIQKIDSGEYDVDMLTDIEREQISIYLNTQKH